jgi:hypothetical protein
LIRVSDGDRTGRAPSNVSTMIIRPPQQGHRRAGEGVSVLSASAGGRSAGRLGRGEQLPEVSGGGGAAIGCCPRFGVAAPADWRAGRRLCNLGKHSCCLCSIGTPNAEAVSSREARAPLGCSIVSVARRVAARNVNRGSILDADPPPYGVRPCRWTGSGRGFDRLPGVLILELHRAEIAERGVQSLYIVHLIDEAWKVGRDVLRAPNSD